MNHRLSSDAADDRRPEERDRGPQPVGDILAELLARYQVRFPEAKIVVVHAPTAA